VCYATLSGRLPLADERGLLKIITD
jgi:hypothetical protein